MAEVPPKREARMVAAPWQDVLDAVAPDAFEAFQGWLGAATGRGRLGLKVEEFIILALDAADRWGSPYMEFHIRTAMEAGATEEELVDVFLLVGAIAGPHSMNFGLTTLARVLGKIPEEPL
jgi:alkylhydroperoxidase/carboxymuconolactone decarboxylase family protein YurZ